MLTKLLSTPGVGPVLLALGILGCVTATTITGHTTGTEFLGVVGVVGGTGGLVTTAHVVGNQVNAATTTPPGSSGPAPGSTV